MEMVSSSIPLRDGNKAELVLVVLLGDVFHDETRRTEICKMIDARSRFVAIQNNNYWPRYVIRRRYRRDVYDNSGTLADIYDVAAEAKALGWKALMIVDELTWRQHTGIVTNREDPTRTATVINLECVQTDAVLLPETTFYIRRLPIVMAIGECAHAKPQKPRDWHLQTMSHGFQIDLHAGFYLRCPDEPIFGDYLYHNRSRLRNLALDKVKNLPQELRDHIIMFARQEEAAPLREFIDTKHIFGDWLEGVSMLLQPLVYLTDDERAAVHSIINPDDTATSYHLGEWKKNFPASRQHVSRILYEMVDVQDKVVFILRSPASDQTLEAAVFHPTYTNGSTPEYGVMYRTSSIDIIRSWLGLKGWIQTSVKMSQLNRDAEVFTDPQWAFPPSLPYWHKSLPFQEPDRVRDRGYSAPEHMRHRGYLCFYLTSSLTDQERAVIEDIVGREDAAGEGFTFVPWNGDVDGGPEDMLRFTKMVWHATRTVDETFPGTPLVFIDRKSARDQRAIVCSRRLVLNHGYSGIEYGRLGEEIPNFLVNVPGNISFDELIPDEEVEFFKDPDYTGPLVEEDYGS